MALVDPQTQALTVLSIKLLVINLMVWLLIELLDRKKQKERRRDGR